MTKPIGKHIDGAIESIKTAHCSEPARAIDQEGFNRHSAAVLRGGFDRQTPANFDTLVRYRWALGNDQAKRGICLMGTTGTGKSLAFRVLKLRVREARDMVDMYKTDKYREVVRGYNNWAEELAIDESVRNRR